MNSPLHPRRCLSLLAVLPWLGLAVATLGAAPATQPAVQIIRLPDGALVPDVLVDNAGILHMVYGLGDYAWYVRSADNGQTFSRPVQINAQGKVQLTMGERGPKLALGKNGTIHVVWMDRWSPGAKCYVRHARSTDGGKTFQPPQQISSMAGVDGVTLAADPQGNVLAFWHAAVPQQQAPVPQATRMFLSRSRDDGVRFDADERVKITNLPDLACSMCMMRARIGSDGNAYLAFRTAVDNIRDFYLLKSPADQNAFTALRVNQDNWELKTCPMCGPELTLDSQGRALVAFMSRNRVYWSTLAPSAQAFTLHVATPTAEMNEIYPAAIANRKGDVLMLWQVGPMSVQGKATVKWALYHQDGSFTGQAAAVGTASSGTKPTAFAGSDDRFYILTTAR